MPLSILSTVAMLRTAVIEMGMTRLTVFASMNPSKVRPACKTTPATRDFGPS